MNEPFSLTVACKKCGRTVDTEDLDMEFLVAGCSHCSTLFSFSDQVKSADKRPVPRSPVPMPKGISVEDSGKQLTISRKWFGPAVIFIILFTLFWNGFMLVWYTIAVSQQEWLMAVFGSLHLAVGLGLLYYSPAGIFNTTTIDVIKDGFEIKHGPIPYPGHLLMLSESIQQLYCREKVNQGKNGTTCTYELHALTRDGKDERILKGLSQREQVLFLEQEIEKYIGITDTPVPGEIFR